MKAIKKELGEDEGSVEIKELEEKIKAVKMPEESQKVAMKELDRLSRIPTQSPEYNVSRTPHRVAGGFTLERKYTRPY